MIWLALSKAKSALPVTAQGFDVYANSTLEGRASRLEWSAVRSRDACAGGTDPLVFAGRRHSDTLGGSKEGDAPGLHFMDCITTISMGQQEEVAQRDGGEGTLGGFWLKNATDGDGLAAAAGVGFNYTWGISSDTGGGQVEMVDDKDRGIEPFLIPGELPANFDGQGFTALPFMQQGLALAKLPPGSYDLTFTTVEVCTH